MLAVCRCTREHCRDELCYWGQIVIRLKKIAPASFAEAEPAPAIGRSSAFYQHFAIDQLVERAQALAFSRDRQIAGPQHEHLLLFVETVDEDLWKRCLVDAEPVCAPMTMC